MYKIKIFANVDVSITDFYATFSKLGLIKTSIEILPGFDNRNNINLFLLTSDDLTEIMEFGSDELYRNEIYSTQNI